MCGIAGIVNITGEKPILQTDLAKMTDHLSHRGPDGNGYYCVFPTRDAQTSILRENPVFAINQAREPLAEKGRGFVLNLRVDNLHDFLERLHAAGVQVEERILEWERGKHGWIRDLDGNRLEIYEEVFPES